MPSATKNNVCYMARCDTLAIKEVFYGGNHIDICCFGAMIVLNQWRIYGGLEGL
jgi:hypothetical protein